MNVKPGDLAYIRYSDFPENIGVFVTVLRQSNWRRSYRPEDGHVWECKPHGEVTGDICWDDGTFYKTARSRESIDVPDSDLRRIDNPGDDAVDEMVQLLGKPEKVAA